MNTVKVLTKKHPDNSGFYVVRVYRNDVRAEEDLILAKEDSLMTWALDEVPMLEAEGEEGDVL